MSLQDHIREAIGGYAEDLQNAKTKINHLVTENESLKNTLNEYLCIGCGEGRGYYGNCSKKCVNCEVYICIYCADYSGDDGYCKKCSDTLRCCYCGRRDVSLVQKVYNTVSLKIKYYCTNCDRKITKN